MKSGSKILLVNVFSGRNIGDAAMTISAIRLLKKAFPDCGITCHTPYTVREMLAKIYSVSIKMSTLLRFRHRLYQHAG